MLILQGYNTPSLWQDNYLISWSPSLSRVISIETTGKERDRLSKAIVAALRELAKYPDPDPEVMDLIAFIILALNKIHGSIEGSVVAWEKRDYWVKADRFRIAWAWTGKISGKLSTAIFSEDWVTIAQLLAEIGLKLNRVKVSDRHHLGTPWIGSWAELKKVSGR